MRFRTRIGTQPANCNTCRETAPPEHIDLRLLVQVANEKLLGRLAEAGTQ